MISKKLLGVVLFIFLIGCVEPYEIKDIATNNTLVIEGMISGEEKRHQIRLSRATSLNDETLIPERDAEVTISDDGAIIALTEATAGVYETPIFSAAPGHQYTLRIKTSAGGLYESQAVLYQDGPGIKDVYVKYIDNPDGDGRGLQVYLDTEDPGTEAHFYRWNYIETYEVHAPFPSNWVWLGGNEVEFRYDGIDTCYRTDTLRTIILRNTTGLEKNSVAEQRLRYIPDYSHIFRYRYSILVQQFSLSEQSYRYWDNLRIMSENQGSLSDLQPGSLVGNIRSVNNPDETVLGYFDAGKMTEKRIFFSAITFYNEGLKMPKEFRSNCLDIAPILVEGSRLEEAMKKYEHTMYIWEVAGMVPNAIFSLRPKSCCDCRDQGPTERPSYF